MRPAAKAAKEVRNMRKLRLLLSAAFVLALPFMPNFCTMHRPPPPACSTPPQTEPDLHLITAVTDANFEKEVKSIWVDKPVLIWLVRPERAAVFANDAKVFEQMAECWSGYVKFVRVDVTKVRPGSALDELLGISRRQSTTFTIMQCVCDEDLHHHDAYLHWPDNQPATLSHVQSVLLDFKPDCPRSRCDNCAGKIRLGRRPLAWR